MILVYIVALIDRQHKMTEIWTYFMINDVN